MTPSEKELSNALETMNNVSLHQTDRIFPPMQIGDTTIPSRVHPLTCGNNSNHTPLFPYWNGAKVQLICRDCDYTQDNAGPCGVAETMTFEHSRDLRCVLNSLGECLAKVPEACQCMKMPRLVYEEARKKFGDVAGEA